MKENELLYSIDLLPIYLDKIKKQIKKAVDNDLKKYNLNHIQVMHMLILYKNNDGLTLGQLANKIGIDKANTTRAILNLINLNYVTKEEKNKGYKITLTKKGLEIAKYFSYCHEQKIIKILNDLDKSEQQKIMDILEKVLKRLKED